MDIRISLLIFPMLSSTILAKDATLLDKVSFLNPAWGFGNLLGGRCPGTKIPAECEKLTSDGQESSCCPTCDLVWPPTVSAYQEVVKDPTSANLFLASARTAQLAALAVAGTAGAIPFVGDSAANPANALVTGLEMILPEQMSDDIKCMREQFVKVAEQMEQMEGRIRKDIQDLKKAVEAQNFYGRYMDFRVKLSKLRGYFYNLQDAISNNNCNHTTRDRCEAVRMWVNHCNVTDPGNHVDPSELFQELNTLVTEKFIGRNFLDAAANDDSSLKHLFEIYYTISNDIMELNMLNIKCAVAVTTKEDLLQRLYFANKQVTGIKQQLTSFLKPFIKAQLDKDTQKLINETREFKDYKALDQALDKKEKTTHGFLITQHGPLAAIEISKEFPLFRTYCTIYPRLVNEVKQETHNLFLAPPEFKPSAGNEDMQMHFKKTNPRVHITDVPGKTLKANFARICYTYVPQDDDKMLETMANNIEFSLCTVEYIKWRHQSVRYLMDTWDTMRSDIKSKPIHPNDWKPISPFCEPWKSHKVFFPAGVEKAKALSDIYVRAQTKGLFQQASVESTTKAPKGSKEKPKFEFQVPILG